MAVASTVIATLDKTVYAPGERMVLTVVYDQPGAAPNTAALTVTDDTGRSWDLVSDNGSVAVYRAVA